VTGHGEKRAPLRETHGAVYLTEADHPDVGRPFDDKGSVAPAASSPDLGHEHPGEDDGGDRHDQADHDDGGEAALEDGAGRVGFHAGTLPMSTLGPDDFPLSSMGDPFSGELWDIAAIMELAAGIEHERRVYARCLARAADLRGLLSCEEERREEAFGNLAMFGRSPFVEEWKHHIPPPDPASCAAFAALLEVR